MSSTITKVPLPPGARLLAALVSVLSLVALGGTVYDYSFGFDAVLRGMIDTTLYYTHWATAIVAAVFAAIAFGIHRAGRSRVIGHVIIMMMILLGHYWYFRGLGDFVESPLRSKLVHGVLPVLIATYWLLFTDKCRLTWRNPIEWTAMPLLYTCHAIVRGALTGEYAYDVGDVDALGYAKVLALVGLTIVLSLVAGYLLLGIDRLLPERWEAGALLRRVRA